MSAPSAVRLERVSKSYGSVVAVRDVSLDIPPGELVTLLGPSGCGKTTTLRLIAGLERATSGRVFIAGRDVTALPPGERDVTMVFQSYALFPHMSVLDNVGYGLKVSGRPRAEIAERAHAALALVGLHGLGDRSPAQLSGGQQQRVAVARAIVLEPAVLLFDEPLSNLDARLRRSVRGELRELQQRLGLTAVYVTHDQEEALAVADRIVVMRAATIAQAGTPREIFEQPADRFVADFVGEANLLDIVIVAVDGELADARLGAVVLRLPARGLPSGDALLAVRPEAVELHDAAHGAPLRGRVLRAAWLGARVEYTVETVAGPLFVRRPASEPVRAVGDDVTVAFAPAGVCLLPR